MEAIMPYERQWLGKCFNPETHSSLIKRLGRICFRNHWIDIN